MKRELKDSDFWNTVTVKVNRKAHPDEKGTES